MVYKLNKVLAALFLLAFLVKATIPAGFMLDKGASGGFEITICSAQGLITKIVNFEESPFPATKKQHHEQNADQNCAYASVLAYSCDGILPAANLERINHKNKIIITKEIRLNHWPFNLYEAQAPPAFLA